MKEGRGKGEEEIRGGQKRRGKKSVKEGEEKKQIIDRKKNWDLVEIEPMPGLAERERGKKKRRKKKALHRFEPGSTDTKG